MLDQDFCDRASAILFLIGVVLITCGAALCTGLFVVWLAKTYGVAAFAFGSLSVGVFAVFASWAAHALGSN